MIKRLVKFITENKWRYRLQGNRVRVVKNGHFDIGSACCLTNNNIFIENGSLFRIGNNVRIYNCNLYIKGNVSIGNNTILKDGTYTIDDGKLEFGHHCKSAAKRFWIRFGGVVNIGDYTNINGNSEIRCDESIIIGKYSRISYNVKIWDTNTHMIYPAKKRRNLTEKYWPYFGREIERPATKPVYIGDDCWIGENSAILKGTMLNKEVIVGYNTVIIGLSIDKGKKVVNAYNLRIL